MAKVKAVLFHSDFCQDGEIKFKAGNAYPKTPETERCVTLNFGDITSVDEDKINKAAPTAAERAAAEQQAAEDKAAADAAAEKAKQELAAAEQAVKDAQAAADAEQDKAKKAELLKAVEAAQQQLAALKPL